MDSIPIESSQNVQLYILGARRTLDHGEFPRRRGGRRIPLSLDAHGKGSNHYIESGFVYIILFGVRSFETIFIARIHTTL